MRTLPLPTLNAADALKDCADNISDAGLVTRLKAIAPLVKKAEKDYLARGPKAELYLIGSATDVGALVTKKEMTRVYDGTFVRKTSPVRQDYYDVLFASAPYGTCPFCFHRSVATLDHYLPKAKYPALAITPANLVPSCFDCNKGKSTTGAVSQGSQILHPYFDDVDDEIWLFANMIEQDPPAVTFEVRAPQDWPMVKRERVAAHFRDLKLNALFTAQGGRLINDIGQRLNELREKGGVVAVSEYLAAEADTRRSKATNSWQAAAYDAMSSSVFFCAYEHPPG